jgi:hypothetical protein
VITSSPPSGVTIRVAFHDGRPKPSDAVLFLADASCCDSFIDEWCPNVNLFEDRPSAERWAGKRGLVGTVVSISEGTELAAREWRPLVDAAEAGTAS